MTFHHNSIPSILAVCLGLTSIGAIAGQGTAKFQGVGRTSAAPEFVTLQVTVNSICYATPAEAQQATDRIAHDIFDILKAKVDGDTGPQNGVFSSGGYTSPYSENIYENGQTRRVCANTFQKSTTLTLKTSNVAKFQTDFADIQSEVYSNYQVGGSDENGATPRSFVTLGSPSAEVTHQTLANLERDALSLALQDAQARFVKTYSTCELNEYSISSTAEPQVGEGRGPVPYAARFGASAESAVDGNNGAPVAFDEIWVSKSLNVEFNFDIASCGEANKKK